MKFLVDEQLPWKLVRWLTECGCDAIHSTSLGSGVKIPDSSIAVQSMREQRIVISKDIDFFNRYVFRQEPYKLLYLTTGNISNHDLLQLFEANWAMIETLLAENAVIEMNQESILIRF